jgi:hypothetical protein
VVLLPTVAVAALVITGLAIGHLTKEYTSVSVQQPGKLADVSGDNLAYFIKQLNCVPNRLHNSISLRIDDNLTIFFVTIICG